ncbi:adhesion G protein-coupled receptor E1-like [Dreissena polymorpha]|uniref:adhesion G protein-coupled receptor E1-like n=1 Tax=Dreissena polymorpha TaxID=45954 RepID=UPI002264E5A8|nr:adhesion G protein-coupled receptor E1-like [Dreissena polymorpha]
MECGSCMAGFVGNNCTDIDECTALGYDLCARFGTGACVNTLGSFKCTCSMGWTGPRCQYVDENVVASDRVCLGGFVNKAYNETYGECRDIDECSNSITNTCGFHQHCKNTAGSYKCDCDIGWEGSSCGKDIDECTRANICGMNQHCINNDGSYICIEGITDMSTTDTKYESANNNFQTTLTASDGFLHSTDNRESTVDGGHTCMNTVHSSVFAKQNPEKQQETKLDVVLGSIFGTMAFISGFLVALVAYKKCSKKNKVESKTENATQDVGSKGHARVFIIE